jgi:hypothetical protein
MRIERVEMEQAFEAFAQGGSGVLIGAPGSGKSYSLRRFVAHHLNEASSYPFFVPVDRLPELSEVSLAAELGVEDDLFGFLEADAADATRCFFIIDALDAARSDRGRALLMHLVRRACDQLSDRWRVIVSVRTYDALRSEDLEEIFGATQGHTPEEYRLRGVVCRHFFIPPLTDEEILPSPDAGGLLELRTAAGPELRDILRTPFTIWLLDRIIAGGGASEVGGLRSEIELLSLFWRLRVDSGDLAIDRRLTLERTTDAMLAARTLSIRTSDVYLSAEQAAWHDLHSSEVLSSTTFGHSRTAFCHNILFDYAISILSLETTDEGPVRFLEEDPSRALFLRPSLHYFFLRLWHEERATFWSTLFVVSRSDKAQVRLFTRVLPPTILATEVRALGDLDPLLEQIGGDASAAEIVLRVLQALRFAGVPRPQVWASVCQRLADVVSEEFAWELALVLNHLSEIDEPPEVRQSIGSAARTLLQWAFNHRRESGLANRLGSVWLVPLVAQTIETDPVAASELLGAVVTDIGDDTVSVDYAYRLADQLNRVWPVAPELAASFFRNAFGHIELSEERTHMGGIVVSLTSNRRQDFDMVQWNLKRHATSFLREAPDYALPALVEAINVIVRNRELVDLEVPRPEAPFEFDGIETWYVRDGSHFWDATGAIRGDAQELMDTMLQYLDDLADAEERGVLRDALRLIAGHARMAFIWRKLLGAGARRPDVYSTLLFDLLIAEPILSGLETVREGADFLGAAIPHLSVGECLEIERAIVSVADADEDPGVGPIGRFIQRLPEDRLQTPEGRRLKELTQANEEAQTNRPLVEFHTSSGPYTEEMWLTERGVNLEDPSLRELSELATPLGSFENEHRNVTPPRERITAAIADIQRVLDTLTIVADVPEALEDSIFAKLGGAAVVLARQQSELKPAELEIVRRVLVTCASGRAPRPETAGEFTTPAWSPAARNEAAQGLPYLAPTPGDDEVISAIRALAADPIPSVRFLLALDLWRISESAPSVYWELIQRYLETESNATVLDAAARSLGAVASSERQPLVESALESLLRRDDVEVGSHKRFKADDNLSSLLVGLAIGRGSSWATGVVRAPLQGLPERAAEAAGYAWFVLQYLHVDRVGIPDFESSTSRAIDWLTEAVASAAEAIRAAVPDESAPDALKETFEIVDDVVSRLYFNSGLYERTDRPSTAPSGVCEYFHLTRDLLFTVAEQVGGDAGTGLPASTAHHFVELLRGVVRCDPIAVVHLARLVVAAAQGSGYAFDSLAAREVTELVEELLADHREMLRDGEPLDDLMFLLDTFVAAGWPDAQHVVFRLEEIFR